MILLLINTTGFDKKNKICLEVLKIIFKGYKLNFLYNIVFNVVIFFMYEIIKTYEALLKILSIVLYKLFKKEE